MAILPFYPQIVTPISKARQRAKSLRLSPLPRVIYCQGTVSSTVTLPFVSIERTPIPLGVISSIEAT